MLDINKKYPQGFSDREIADFIRQHSEEISDSGAQANTVLRSAALIQLGQNELQDRKINRMNEHSGKIILFSLGVSFISLMIAGIALFFSLEKSESRERLEKEHLHSLNSINENMVKQTRIIEEEAAKIEKLSRQYLTRDKKRRTDESR